MHYPRPLHLQPAAAEFGYGPGAFPVCEAQAERILTLPAHQELSDAQVDYMLAKVHEFYAWWVPYIDLPAEFGRPEILAAVQEQLSAAKLVGGPAVAEFETRFAALCGVQHAVGVNSGTDALFLVFKALGIGPGPEVITAPNSFEASAGSIVAAGATPVFADVGPDYQLDPEAVRRALTPLT